MKTIKSFEFKNTTNKRYDWSKLLDGGIYELKRGVDFSITTTNFRATVYGAGRRRGMKVRVHELEDGVVLQAYKPEKTP